MSSISQSKKDFLVKQGYSKETINYLTDECEVNKNILCFLIYLNRTKGSINPNQKSNVNKIKLIDSFLLSNPKYISTNDKLKSIDLEKIYIMAKKIEDRKQRIISRTIHKFEDGMFITNIHHLDAVCEGEEMANCVKGYSERLKDNEMAVLALKDKDFNTIVHLEINKRGMITQIYEKANSVIKSKYNKYIIEFFELNNKNLNFKNLFEPNYLCTLESGRLNVHGILPLCVRQDVRGGKNETSFEDYFTINNFTHERGEEGQISQTTKEGVVNFIEEHQKKMNKFYEDLIKRVQDTNLEKMFLSDQMKRKLFGEDFLLRGNNISYHDFFSGESESKGEIEPINPEGEIQANNGYGRTEVNEVRIFGDIINPENLTEREIVEAEEVDLNDLDIREVEVARVARPIRFADAVRYVANVDVEELNEGVFFS